jgi:hypothetical protein
VKHSKWLLMLGIVAVIALVLTLACGCKKADKQDPAHGLDKAPAGSPGPGNVPPVSGPKADAGAATKGTK